MLMVRSRREPGRCQAEVLRLTRRWGIVSTFVDTGLPLRDYMLIAGAIANRHAQAVLREHLFVDFNKLLAKLALPQVECVGLPTSAGIEAALRELRAGDIDFERAMERTQW